MTAKRVIDTLSHLYGILEAGEKGYAVAAANVNNRGLKILFRSFAQQRADFKAEVLSEIHRLDGNMRPPSNFLGVIHRGRIIISATLIIERDGRERMVVKEVARGERIALQTYEKALKRELPAQTRAILERQYQQVKSVVEQALLLSGVNGKRLVVCLYESEADVERVIQSLNSVGFPPESVEKLKLGDMVLLYQGKGSTRTETLISGAVGGAFGGSIFGLIAGFWTMQAAFWDPPWQLTPLQAGAIMTFGCIAGGTMVGTGLGHFIGIGVSEEDTHQLAQSLQNGHTIIKILIDEARAREADQILTKVLLERAAA